MSKNNFLDIARECGLGHERWNTEQQLFDFIERYGEMVKKFERERCLAQVEREKNLWRFNSCYRSVNTALESLKAMIRGTP